jgi:hypothetical protein
MNKPITFELAKLLKEKKFKEQSLNFYTKPNSKMFGIDEHYRNYSIKNIPKKLYTVGVHAVLNIENIYFAPSIADVVMWLYEKHKIYIWASGYKRANNRTYFDYYFSISKLNDKSSNFFNSPTEAYEAAIEYTLKNLI